MDVFLERDNRPAHYPTAVGATPVSLNLHRAHERGFGERVAEEIFLVRPGTPYFPLSDPSAATRLVIQFRTRVRLESRGARGEVSAQTDRAVAIGAFGDPPLIALTWVQTVRLRPERIVHASAGTMTGYLGLPNLPEPGGGFPDRDEWWLVDSGSRASTPRYSGAGFAARPLRDPMGEVIYDWPSLFHRYGAWISEHPDVLCVDALLQFRTYLTALPGRPPLLSRTQPLAVVEWSWLQRISRPAAGAPAIEADPQVRLHWIVPNPPVPPNMRRTLASFTAP